MKDSKPLSFAAAARSVTFVIYVGLALTADLAECQWLRDGNVAASIQDPSRRFALRV